MRRGSRLFMLIAAAMLAVAWTSAFNKEIDAGNNCFKEKKYSEAVEHYIKAAGNARNDTERAIANFNMGDVEYSMGNYGSAVEYYKKSALSPDKEVVKKSLLNMGNSYLRSGKKKEAAEAYAKALELDPEYEKARKNLEYLNKNSSDKSKDNNSEDGSTDSSEGKKGEGNSGSKKQGAGGDLTPEQMQRIFDSMKKKPVRKQKGDGDGRKLLENYW